MTVIADSDVRVSSVQSADGTSIGYCSLGVGPGLIVVGGVLSSGASYRRLADKLADTFEVHLVNRRGRAGSGPQRTGHSIEQECDDLLAVIQATGARLVFGHSFGGLVALETARRRAGLERVYVYEPGVPLHGHLNRGWLAGYERFLEQGDRRGAFAWMVKHAGFAPWPLGLMPLGYVRAVLRLAIGPRQWATMEPLLDANLGEHRIQAALDTPSADRFSTITAHTVLMGGTRSPDFISRGLLTELAQVIPDAVVAVLPGLGHRAPEDRPDKIAARIRKTGPQAPAS
jgi:pimeloyl-ACP methyl ester carboxylesterase